MCVDEPVHHPVVPPPSLRLPLWQRGWVPMWARLQRWSLTRRCLMCDNVVGARPPGESVQYCSDLCRDRHYSCGG